MECHKELHPMMNVYGKIRQVCPKCGIAYYEDVNKSAELCKLEIEAKRKDASQ